LPLQELGLGDLLSYGAQVLQHDVLQARAHGEALPTVELGSQRFDAGQ
jgi:hypothetical protein